MSIREELNQWMLENLTGEFEQIRWRGGPGDEDSSPELRRAWEQKFGEAGWIGLQWPKEYGGRDLSLMDFVEFNEEYARHGGPGRAAQQAIAAARIRQVCSTSARSKTCGWCTR